MDIVIASRNSTTVTTCQMASGILQQVARRLLLLAASPCTPRGRSKAAKRPSEVIDQTALPDLLPQIAALLGFEQFAAAERLLATAIGGLSATVPPQSPQLREWLLLALFGLLHEDAASADAYLRQAQWQLSRHGAMAQGADSLFFVLQLTRCLASLAARRSGAAEELLDACEGAEEAAGDPQCMWLVLQLRTVSALQASQFRTAWQTWQAAMAIQQTQRVLRLTPSVGVPGRLWLQKMALVEVAAANN